ncbi:sensor histidine kinase [Bacillus sp. EB01]|uniref:sensor histidine kinase n=1 Tax=Bacillus sp. EB01 TaxID=1347086 RepID=UPI0005C582E5|nr:HAMP domain-containing sensor histidine kinase [Bacillus sp. EB01]
MRTLYVKFIVMTASIMVISFLLSFLISNAYYQQELKPSNDAKNTAIAKNIAAFTEKHPSMNLDEYFENIAAVGYQIYLINSDGIDGSDQFYGEPFRDKSLPYSIIKEVQNGTVYHGIRDFPHQTFVTGFFANELRNTIGVPLTHNGENYALFIRPDIKLLFNEMHILFGWILALSIGLSMLMVIVSTKYLVKPITSLTKATRLLAKGEYDVQIETAPKDELGELSRSFLKMVRKLEKSENTRKEFISNISHDIQSSLSNIKGYTNLLENEKVSAEERSQYVSVIHEEINRLSSLTKQLLLLASLDRNDDIMKKGLFNVGQQIQVLIKSYQWVIGEKELMLEYSLPDTTIFGDASLLNTVWDNLLSNAIKYTNPGGKIEIKLTKIDNSLFITFEDSGIGLKDTEQERIFDRFYRADLSRNRSVEGTGLGLSIAATIVKLHDGRISVKSREAEGTTFTVELPL